MTIWVFINTAKEVGDEDHLKVFAGEEAAERWLPSMTRKYPVFT